MEISIQKPPFLRESDSIAYEAQTAGDDYVGKQ